MARAYKADISSSYSSFQYPYDVFLSFRGEDTRTNFTDHLYTALTEAKLHVFRDDDEIERGMNVEFELKRAIEQSRVSIVVFSRTYASSRWCLDELLRILHQKKTVEQQVLPVFYDVSPSEVRNQTGNFKKAFEEHERIFRLKFGEYEEGVFDKLQKWRKALKEAADLSGFVLENQANRHEARLIKDHIIPAVLQKINHKVFSEPLHLIGIDGHVEEITSWLQDGSSEVGILVIHGMGGIGKTTIAKVIYNLNIYTFDETSFLEDIREISRTFRGLVLVQKRLLSDISKGRKLDIDNVDHGITLITKALCRRRALLILDDIDEEDQLDAILRQYHQFCPGSKIIITTRDASLLRAYSATKLHKVGMLEDKESLELFSWHAFKQGRPIEGYMELSERAIEYCGAVPLSLQVLGSSLCHRNLDIWINALEKFEAIPHRKIIEKLRVSFDCLPDDSVKNLFLDISCFFLGEDKDYIAKILEKCDLFPTFGIEILKDRCLLNIDAKNKLKMHRLLRDMGREIVRQESIDNPGERSRIWQSQDSFDVLKGRTGTNKIHGLSLDMCFLNKHKIAYEVGTTVANSCELESEAFATMQQLKLLQLNYVHLMGSFKLISKEIRWLCWHGFPQKCLPDDFNFEKVVAIDMQYSRLKCPWKGIKFFAWLTFLNLSHSYCLVSTPNFYRAPNLERISLKFCTSLTEVHESIVKLNKLLVLNLRGCTSLRKLPTDIHQMKSLKRLVISGCSKLGNKLPEELDDMPSLEVLAAEGISQSLLETRKLRLRHIFFFRIPTIRRSRIFSLPSLPQSLRVLRLRESNISDHALPKNLGNLSLLYILDLSRNPIQNLPKSIKQLNKLWNLEIIGCSKLLTVPELPCGLHRLSIAKCKSIEKLTNMPNQFRGLHVDMHGCPKLVEVEKIFKLQPLENIEVEMMQNLGLEDMGPVKSLKVKLLNLMTSEANYFPIQGLLEFGIFSIFLPGNRIPDWFSNYRNVRFSIEKDLQDDDVCSVSFAMPSLPNIRFQGLNIGVVYSSGEQGGIYHLVNNRTKDIGWVYSPTFTVAANSKDVIFLSHWNVESLFEVGDELDIRLSGLKMKTMEIQLVYFQEHVQDNQCSTLMSLRSLIDTGNLSDYECSRDRHFLCHYHYNPFPDPGNIICYVFGLIITILLQDVEKNKSVLHQYLMNSLDLQDSWQITFADLQQSYILRLIPPLLVAVDYHSRRSPNPISYIIVEMATLFKWLIRYPEFVPDSNFIQGCHLIALAELVLLRGRFETEDVHKIYKETIYKLNQRSMQIGQHQFVVNNLWLEDGSNKADIRVVRGIDGIGNITIAKIVYNLNRSTVEACSFLENIVKTSEELNGYVHFQ